MNELLGKYVCGSPGVEIEGYSITSSPPSKCRIAASRFSPQGSQLCVHGYFSTVK